MYPGDRWDGSALFLKKQTNKTFLILYICAPTGDGISSVLFYCVCLSVCVCLSASQGWGCLFRGIRDSAGLLSFYSCLTASSNLDQKVPTPTHPQLHQQHCSLSIYFEGKTCVRDAQTHTWVLHLVSNSQMWVYMAVLLWWHGKRKEMVDLSE